MQSATLNDIGRVIQAHTMERSIDELRAEGKKRVRVVSGRRVMEIIQAVVDDAIGREVGAITERDRGRIVRETKTRFESVLRAQQDMETRAEELRKQLAAADRERERLRSDKAFLSEQVRAARARPGADATLALDALRAELTDGELRAQRRHDALVRRMDTLEIGLGERLSGLNEQVSGLDERLTGFDGRLDGLHERAVTARPAPTAVSDAGFQQALDRALDQITRTMQRATARPIDVSVEATDVLLDKLLDGESGEMTSNLDRLDVEERRAGGVGHTLGRLRALAAAAPTGTDH